MGDVVEAFPRLDPYEVTPLFSLGIQAAIDDGSAQISHDSIRSMLERQQADKQESAIMRLRAVASLSSYGNWLAAQHPAANTNAAPLRRSSIGQRLRAQRAIGPRHSTGIAILDTAMRGGLPVEKVMGICGAPNAGKTSVACQIADRYSRTDVAVGWCCYDGSASEVDARRLQALGVLRQDAENPNEATIAFAERELGSLPFEMYDYGPDGRPIGIEAAALDLAQRYPNQPRCLVVDSIQKAPGEGSKLERVAATLAAIRNVAMNPATRCMVIFTSEVSREFYRNELQASAMNDMAAGKESGDIEYVAQTFLVLRTTKDGDGLVSVSVPKNKLGSHVPDFLLKQDFARTTFTHVADGGANVDAKQALKLAPLRAKALELLKANPGILKSALKGLMRGKAADAQEAINSLVDERLVRFTLNGNCCRA
jgi:RecA/RadA recombinase